MNILMLYYTQSGQTKEILENIFADTNDHLNIDYQPIEPVNPFPFPWTADTFFDAMPESVLQTGTQVKPLPQLLKKDYDLIILGYQPWFLHPSIPILGFLNSEWAKILSGKPIITVVGCRNMWLNAQEIVKSKLNKLGADLVGNIVLCDKHPNIISTLTVIRWMFKGQKKASGILPDAGVAQSEIYNMRKYGNIILNAIKNNKDLQSELLNSGAVNLKPNLILLEKRGINQFPKWARKARKKGLPGSKARQPILRTFKKLLLVAIFVLSPISSLSAAIQAALNRKKLSKQVHYFKGVTYIEQTL